MAAKSPEIIIGQGKQAWQNGIALSPYLGFGDMKNVDVSLWPGVVKISLAAAKKTSTTITGQPMWAAQDTDANATIYVLDNLQNLYKSDKSSNYITWTKITHASPSTGHGNGLAVWHSYVFIAGDAAIDVYNISLGTWSDAWMTLFSDVLTHPMLGSATSTNDILYIGNGPDTGNNLGPTVASVIQNTNKVFSPTDATTYTKSSNAVGANLLYGYRIRCLTQMGSNLYIGTFYGTTPTDQKLADIFPWDRSSSSFGIPIRFKEFGINQMLTNNNVIYVQAGTMGNFYVTNGSLTQLLFNFPRNTPGDENIYTTTTTYPGAITLNKGRIFFGITTGNSTRGHSGVYSVNLDGSGLVCENTISTGNSNSQVAIGCIYPTLSSNMEYLIGWQDSGSSAQGVDIVGEDGFNTSYTATIDSPVYITGTVLSPNSLQQIEIYLDRPLASGEGIKILQRTSLGTAWSSATTLVTFDFATYGAVQKYNFPIGANSSGEMLQFRVALTCTSGSNGTSPTLRYVRII